MLVNACLVGVGVLFFYAKYIDGAVNSKRRYLTENLFAGLNADPYLLDEGVTERSVKFVDKQIENYLKLMGTPDVRKRTMSRRSLLEEDGNYLKESNAGAYVIEGFIPLNIINPEFATDLQLFMQDNSWYAFTLETNQTQKFLVLYKYNDDAFNKIERLPVTNATVLEVFPTRGFTFVVLCNYKEGKKQTAIFKFNPSKENFTRIQLLDTVLVFDVAIWENYHEIFLVLAQRDGFKTNIEVFRWFGEHFDMVDQIITEESRSLSPFSIGRHQFLAVAIHANENGETDTYSEIYKYDLHEGVFTLQQRISTKNAVDVKYFQIGREHFLVIASFYDDNSEEGVTNYNIVYKYVDDYFIPFEALCLDGVLQWLPVGTALGEFVLLANSKYDGVRSFNYDGWSFTESNVSYEFHHEGIASMRSYIFQDKLVLVTANRNNEGEIASIFELKFSLDETSMVKNELLKWCRDKTAEIKALDKDEIVKAVEQAPTSDKGELQFSQAITFDNVTVKSLRIMELDDTDSEDYPESPDISKLIAIKNQLDDQIRELEDLEKAIDSLFAFDPNFLEGDIHADNVIITEDAFLDSLTAESINAINVVDFLQNIIHTSEDLTIDDPVTLEDVRVENVIHPAYINGKKSEDLLHVFDDANLGDVHVTGNVILEEGVTVGGTLNGIKFNENSLMMREGDQQFFPGDANIENVIVDDVETNFLNTLKLSETTFGKTTFVSNITNLHVKNLTVAGYINEVDLPTIDKYVLRVSGDQEITGNYTFDHVHANAITLNGRLNGRTLEELIPISGGTYNIEQDVEFTDTLNIENMTVRNRLNQIEIRDGKLDVLLKNSNESQYIKGNKQFRNVDLLNSVHLQAQIKRKGLDELQPITMIEEDLVLEGDFVIRGNTMVDKFLVTRDIQPVDGKRSLNDVEENGLKITDEEVAFHAEFTQPITVNEINADQINGVDPKSLVVCGSDEVQYIKGSKQFSGDIYVTGGTVLGHVNGIDVSNLEAEVLTIDGDQEIIGKLHVRNLVVEKLQCANTKIGDNWWRDIVSYGNNERIGGTTVIENSLSVNELDVDFLNVNGLVNDYNFTYLMNDAVRFDNQYEIKGHKSLRNLTIDHLDVMKGLDMNELPELISKSEVIFQFDEDVVLPDNIHIESLNVEGNINEMSSDDFKKSWMQRDGEQVFDQEYTFDSVVIYGKAYINSGYINHVKIEDLVLNTVKIDEPFQFDDVTFTDKIVSRGTVILDGHISGLDLENTVVNCDGEQTIMDPITFKQNVSIEGSLFINGLINGLRLSDLCEFASPTVTEDPKSLIINGSAHFSKGPVIKRIGGLPFEDILENAWLSDRETELEGYVEFEDVVFHDDVHVEGLVGEINLQFLADNYFSKSQNQVVTAHLDFTEGVNFFDGVSAPEARLYGHVFGIDLGAFVRTAVLNDVDQTFDDTLILDVCNVEDIQGEYLVNDLNLQRDVMRYDADNIVTGRKTIPNVLAHVLVIEEDVEVQGVKLANWIQRSVLKTGNHAIVGRVTFDGNVTFSKGLGLIGSVNGHKFNKNSVMLYSQPQNITGKKTFLASPITFKKLELKGRLNNVDLVQLVNEQAFKNQDTIFESQVMLDGGAWVENLNIKKSYNGVNVTELLSNLTRFATLNNYYDDYARLLDATNKVRKSLRFQAYYLDYYKAVQVLAQVRFVHPLKFKNAHDRLVISRCVNRTSLIDFYVWDSNTKHFVLEIGNMQIITNSYFSYVNTLEFSNSTYIFSEYVTEDDAEGTNFMGNIFDINNNTSLKIVQQIPSNGTKFVKAFTMKGTQRNCVAVIYFDKDYTNVLCESEEDVDDNLLAIHQQLETSAPSEVITLEIDDAIYLFIVNTESEKRDAHVDVWKSDVNTGLFNLHQIVFTIAPKSATATFYRGVYYLAIASGFLQNATFTGTVEIRRFDLKSERFVHMQDINLAAPTSVEFAILPTEELVLYVLSDSVTKPLNIYMYEGISGFVRKAPIIIPLKFSRMCSFNTNTKDHFVVLQNEVAVHIIKAIFKGQR